MIMERARAGLVKRQRKTEHGFMFNLRGDLVICDKLPGLLGCQVVPMD